MSSPNIFIGASTAVPIQIAIIASIAICCLAIVRNMMIGALATLQ